MSNHVAFSIHTSVIEGRLDDARSLMTDHDRIHTRRGRNTGLRVVPQRERD